MEGGRRRAAKYKRISDDREGRELGVTRQNDDLDLLARRMGFDVVAEYTDNDVSASTRSTKVRPGYDRMLRDARAGTFDIIICYTSSRLTRRPRENEDLIDLARNHGIRYAYVRSPEWDLNTADGREYARMAAARDAGEAERVSERVSRAARQRAENGEWHGGPLPFFLRRVGDVIEPDPERAEHLREAARRVLAGESLYGICDDWDTRGIRTANGHRFRRTSLRYALLSPAAAGLRRYDGKLYPAPWTGALDRTTWDRLHDLMDRPERGFRPAEPVTGAYEGKRELNGIAYCACGGKLTGQTKDGYVRLICHRQATGGCGKVVIKYEPLRRFILDMVTARIDSPSFRAELGRRSTIQSEEETGLREDLAATERRRLGVAEALEIGGYTKAEAAERLRRIEEERTRLQARLAELAREHVLEGVESGAGARDLLETADVTRRRRFLSYFIERVVVSPYPVGWSRTPQRRKTDTDEALAKRREEHERAVLRERVEIEWRR